MASRTPPLDPRIANPPEPEAAVAEEGVRPVVALPRSGPPTAVLVAGMIAAAIILFMILDSRRRSQAEPAVRVRGAEVAGTVARRRRRSTSRRPCSRSRWRWCRPPRRP